MVKIAMIFIYKIFVSDINIQVYVLTYDLCTAVPSCLVWSIICGV